MSTTPSLVVEDVSVERGGTRILERLTFTIHPGELCAVIGPSGAGKSTLIKVLLGILPPSSGRVRLGDDAPGVRPVGYVPQDDALHTTLTVDDELRFAAELRLPTLDDAARRAKIDDVIRAVGIEERRSLRIRQLSGGQRKRVGVALELLTRPQVLILDEPTSGLDPGMERRTMELTRNVANEGHVVLVATHAMESLLLCQALLVVVKGHIAYFGPPEAAAEYFRVTRLASIFDKLPLQSPAAWVKTHHQWPGMRAFRDRAPPVIAKVSVERTKTAKPNPASLPSENSLSTTTQEAATVNVNANANANAIADAEKKSAASGESTKLTTHDAGDGPANAPTTASSRIDEELRALKRRVEEEGTR